MECPKLFLYCLLALFFFISFQKMCTHVRFSVDVAMTPPCAALFLLISLTDSGAQSVNNKYRSLKIN